MGLGFGQSVAPGTGGGWGHILLRDCLNCSVELGQRLVIRHDASMHNDDSATYKSAYGLAGDLGEANNPNNPRRRASDSAAGGTIAKILNEVLRQLDVADGETELVRGAVADVLAGRKKRW